MNDDKKPSEAVILSSLQIQGATLTGGSGKEDFVPVLGSDGKLDTSVIPIDKLESEINVRPLTNLAYIDKEAGEGTEEYIPTGSISSPFRSLHEAASAGFTNFMLTPGNYDTDSVYLTSDNIKVRILSDGNAEFSNLTIGGYADGADILLHNISVTGVLRLSTLKPCDLIVTGVSDLREVQGAVTDPDDTASVNDYLESISIGPEAVIDIFPSNLTLTPLASGSRIMDDSTVDRGTVTGALDHLNSRIISVPVFSQDSGGIAFELRNVPAGSDSSDPDYNGYDLSEVGRTLSEAVNDTFYKEGDSPCFSEVTAEGVTADEIVAENITVTEDITLDNVKIRIDQKFLVVGE